MRHYSNSASEMTLQSSVSESDTAFTLDDVTGLPASFPFVLVIDVGLTNEEAVLCTSLVGVTATVTRGYDNTSATAHTAAAKLRHMSLAIDFRESQEHINNTSAVHGVAGSVVGTTDSQVLANKTISGLTNTITSLPKAGMPTGVVFLGDTQTLTAKSMSGLANTFTNIPLSALVAGTLSGYTLSGLANTLTNIQKSSLPTDTLYDATPAGAWVTLVPHGNWTATGGFTPRARLLPFGLVQVDGAVTSASSVDTNDAVTLDAAFIPTANRMLPGHNTSGTANSKSFNPYATSGGYIKIEPTYHDGGALVPNVSYPISGIYAL